MQLNENRERQERDHRGKTIHESRRILQDLSKTERCTRPDTGQVGLPEGVDIDVAYLQDCLARFNVWIASIGVLRKGDSALDSRLTNPDITAEILRLCRGAPPPRLFRPRDFSLVA